MKKKHATTWTSFLHFDFNEIKLFIKCRIIHQKKEREQKQNEKFVLLNVQHKRKRTGRTRVNYVTPKHINI